MGSAEVFALLACGLIAAGGVALLRRPSGDPTHRLVGGLLVAVAGLCAVVVVLTLVYLLLASPH